MAVYQFETLRFMVFGNYNSTVYHCEIADAVSAMRVANSATSIRKQTAEQNDKITILPNPNNGSFTIVYSKLKNATGDYQISDVSGKIISSGTTIFNEGKSQLNIELAKGMYLIKVQNNGVVSNHKLLISK
jgi:hypothetical protein